MKRIPTLKPSFYVVSMLRKEKPPLDASGYKKKLTYFFYWALCHSTLPGLFSTNTVLHAFKTLQVSMA